MRRGHRLARGALTLAVIAGLLACAAEGELTDSGPSPPVQDATTPAAADTMPPGDGAWDLVWFSDSSGFRVAEAWAELIERDVGVEVRVHDFSVANLMAVTVRDWVRDETSLQHAALADAEVVALFANPAQSGWTSDAASCHNLSEPEPPTRWAPEDLAPYQDVLRDILDVIVDERDGRPTVVRAYDLYVPVLERWRELGKLDECMAAHTAVNLAIAEVAAEYGAATAGVFAAYNGPEHDLDPTDSGLIGSDGIHPSVAGVELTASLLHELGYAPARGHD